MRLIYSFLILGLLACSSEPSNSTATAESTESDTPAEVQENKPTLQYSIELMDESVANLFGDRPEFEELFSGMSWSEGPLWLDELQTIICSDVPNNRILSWNANDGYQPWLENSGFRPGDSPSSESGSNGLILDAEGRLVLCQHGLRQVARMDATLDDPQSNFTTLADNYEGKRFNSPNDLVYDSSGVLYFTDPPYGLNGQDEDPDKELDFNGVYRLDPDGSVNLLIENLTRPNGIGLSPDERMLYVAVSDPEAAKIYAYLLTEDKRIQEEFWVLDLTEEVALAEGLPDGLEVARDGKIYATGPGGVWVISPGGVPLAQVHTGFKISNVELDSKEEYLYMTSDPYLVRVKLHEP